MLVLALIQSRSLHALVFLAEKRVLWSWMCLADVCVCVCVCRTGAEGADAGDQMNELKQKLKSELRALLVEYHDQLKKKKEQHNTEVHTHQQCVCTF